MSKGDTSDVVSRTSCWGPRALAAGARRPLTSSVCGAALAAIVSLSLAGCRFLPDCFGGAEPCECVCAFDLTWLSPVAIIPVCGSEHDDPILLAFCHELATALRHRGVADVIIRGRCEPPCEAKPTEAAFPPEPDALTLPAHLMYVTLPDFRPYRPMRMAVDLRVVHAADQREVARVVEVFEGPQESPLRETPRQVRLFREIEREERADREAYTAFLSNSPREFLTATALGVTDRLSVSAAPVVPGETTTVMMPEIPPSAPQTVDAAVSETATVP